jgi:hypothetical protein
VVHTNSPQVYGHVVATDLFGDAYIIPMLDTLNDIKECTGASSVELPKAKVISEELSGLTSLTVDSWNKAGDELTRTQDIYSVVTHERNGEDDSIVDESTKKEITAQTNARALPEAKMNKNSRQNIKRMRGKASLQASSGVTAIDRAVLKTIDDGYSSHDVFVNSLTALSCRPRKLEKSSKVASCSDKACAHIEVSPPSADTAGRSNVHTRRSKGKKKTFNQPSERAVEPLSESTNSRGIGQPVDLLRSKRSHIFSKAKSRRRHNPSSIDRHIFLEDSAVFLEDSEDSSRQYGFNRDKIKRNECRDSTGQHGSKPKRPRTPVRHEGFIKAHNVLAKRWDPSFSASRPPQVSGSWVESKRGMNSGDCDIDLFLRDAEDSSALYYFDEVRELCYGVCSSALDSGQGEAGNRRAAWLDTRNGPNPMEDQIARDYQNPLTATSLYHYLRRDLTSMRILM